MSALDNPHFEQHLAIFQKKLVHMHVVQLFGQNDTIEPSNKGTSEKVCQDP